MTQNNYILKIMGGAELDKKLDASKILKITNAELSVYSVETKDNHDGTYTQVFKCKITSPIDMIQDQEVVKGEDKRKWSKKLYDAVFFLNLDYDIFMPKLLHNLEDVWEYLKNK
mgnify:CR=1 FL=1